MMEHTCRQWLVFYVKGGRVASIERTPENEREAHVVMHLSLIQEDMTGTRHYNVWGHKRPIS